MSKILDRYAGLINRREALGFFTAATLLGCGGGGSSGSSSTSSATTSSTTTATTGSSTASCVLIPQETVGPYPLFTDIASASVYTRQDITEGKSGVPLSLLLTIVNVNNNCAAITDALVYVWHCDKDGVYSGYGSAAGETFCRGVQMTDSTGLARFTTIYPGWYTGRITHTHFRVYLGNSLQATSQLAFPQDITTAVYNTSQYSARGQNTSVTSFSADGIFADGVQYQLCTMTQNASTGGYDAALKVGIAM